MAWQEAIYLWAGWALVAALAAGLLWSNAVPRLDHEASNLPQRLQSTRRVFMQPSSSEQDEGVRLSRPTADTPKCFAEVGGRRLVDLGAARFRAPADWSASPLSAATDRQGAPRLSPRSPSVTTITGRTTTSSLALLRRGPHGRRLLCCYSDVLFTPEVIRACLPVRRMRRWLSTHAGWTATAARTDIPPTCREGDVHDGVSRASTVRSPRRTPTANISA